MKLLPRLAPALALLLLSPLVAEFLLGDFNVRQLGYLAVFIPVYGAGALLIREMTRRTGRGWPTMLLLATAYALILEGAVNQTLFNPDYAHQRLLDYGFIPALGTSFFWAGYVLTLHVVWSVGSAVALAEGLAGARWRTPWLGVPGLVVTTVLLGLGCAATTAFTLQSFHFMASTTQLSVVAIVAVLLIVAAFTRFRASDNATRAAGRAPTLGTVFVVSLILSSLFQRWFVLARPALNAGVGLAGMLALLAGAIVLLGAWSRRAHWGAEHALAAAAGAIVTYGWISLRRFLVAGGTSLGVPTTPIDVVGQALLLLALLALSWMALRRLQQAG